MERTPALEQELISAQLILTIGNYEVLIEREASNRNNVQVTWQDSDRVSESRIVPLRAGKTPIVNGNIFNLSDLIFYLLGQEPVKVPQSSRKPSDSMVRLSFRDVMWYCYLEQDKLESSFYNLGESANPFRLVKSRFVLSYVVGIYSKRLNELLITQSKILQQKKKREQEVENIVAFLKKFGYSSEDQVLNEIEVSKKKLSDATLELKRFEKGFKKETNFADDLRNELRILGEKVASQIESVNDVNEKIEQNKSLKAELIAAKFKMVRAETAKDILEGAKFDVCPLCGITIVKDTSNNCKCSLCGQDRSEKKSKMIPISEAVMIDLNYRINELDESILRHEKSLIEQNIELNRLKKSKASKEATLEQQLEQYDSKFLSQSRELERQIAKYNERLSGLGRILRMPIALKEIQEDIILLKNDEERLKREIEKEKENRIRAEKIINELESEYLKSLISIGLPQINRNDKIRINRKTWIPEILPFGEEKGKWNFFTIGSAGMKTLLNVCFAISLHNVAATNNLPLPEFLILDDPTKNVDKEVNNKIFEAFYKYLYALAQDELLNTQFILIENSYFPPPDSIESIDRYMTENDENFPPLISYYRHNDSSSTK